MLSLMLSFLRDRFFFDFSLFYFIEMVTILIRISGTHCTVLVHFKGSVSKDLPLDFLSVNFFKRSNVNNFVTKADLFNFKFSNLQFLAQKGSYWIQVLKRRNFHSFWEFLIVTTKPEINSRRQKVNFSNIWGKYTFLQPGNIPDCSGTS